jgi:hypothetical protein
MSFLLFLSRSFAFIKCKDEGESILYRILENWNIKSCKGTSSGRLKSLPKDGNVARTPNKKEYSSAA